MQDMKKRGTHPSLHSAKIYLRIIIFYVTTPCFFCYVGTNSWDETTVFIFFRKDGVGAQRRKAG
jgi:hypothetical protein